MAKSKNVSSTMVADPPDEPVEPAPELEPEPVVIQVPPQMFFYRVTCNPPTPLAANSLKVTATGEPDAWEQFCRFNGISGSDSPKSITQIPALTPVPSDSKEPE